jgi:single-stranded DNA-specific DHH superfamily exonuclease
MWYNEPHEHSQQAQVHRTVFASFRLIEHEERKDENHQEYQIDSYEANEPRIGIASRATSPGVVGVLFFYVVERYALEVFYGYLDVIHFPERFEKQYLYKP